MDFDEGMFYWGYMKCYFDELFVCVFLCDMWVLFVVFMIYCFCWYFLFFVYLS